MKSRAGVHAGLAAALCGMLPGLFGGHMTLFVLLCVVVVVLLLSALILCLHARFSCVVWRRLVNIASAIDVGYTASGFGLAGTGIGLLRPGWWWIGIPLVLIGALLLGAGIGTNVYTFSAKLPWLRSKREKQHNTHS